MCIEKAAWGNRRATPCYFVCPFPRKMTKLGCTSRIILIYVLCVRFADLILHRIEIVVAIFIAIVMFTNRMLRAYKNGVLAACPINRISLNQVLATGLSGLYSLLPRKLDIETDDWHRLTPDDVNDMPALMHLMNSLEFCNAVAQVAHPLVQKQLLEFLYHGFLVPVMAPALLQVTMYKFHSNTFEVKILLCLYCHSGKTRDSFTRGEV